MPRTALGISLGAVLWIAACAGSSDPYLPQPAERPAPQPQEQPAAQPPAATPPTSEPTQETPAQPGETPAAEPTAPVPEPAPQGTSCAASGVSFSLRQPLAACGGVDIVVSAGEGYTWVMAGVGAPGQAVTWRGGATDVGCSGGACRWTFANTSVPCAAGPYTLHFRIDAQNDDAGQGREIASCAP